MEVEVQLKAFLDRDSFASRLWMQMELAGCIYHTTFYTVTLGPADSWMDILFNISPAFF